MGQNLQNFLIIVVGLAVLTALGWLAMVGLGVISFGGAAPETPGAVETPIEEAAAEATAVPEEPERVAEPEAEPPTPPPTAAPATPAARPAASVHDAIAPSTVLLFPAAERDRPIGAGFVLEAGLVVTAAAVVEEAEALVVRPLDGGADVAVSRTARVDRELGLALLRVGGLSAAPAALGAAADVSAGDAIYALAGGRPPRGFAEGTLRSRSREGGLSTLRITLPIDATTRGGPVVDRSGRVVGIADRTFAGADPIHSALGAEALSSLRQGVLAEEEPTAEPIRVATTAPTERPRATLAPEPTEEPYESYDDAEEEPTPAPRPRPTREERDEPEDDAPPRDVQSMTPTDHVVVRSTKLFERPDSSSHVIARLRPNVVVTCVGRAGGFLQVRSSRGARDGWVAEDDVRPARRRR